MDIEHALEPGIANASNAVESDVFRSTGAPGAVGVFWSEHAQTNSARMHTARAAQVGVRTDQKLQQITLSTSLTMIELPVMAGCAHSADSAI